MDVILLSIPSDGKYKQYTDGIRTRIIIQIDALKRFTKLPGGSLAKAKRTDDDMSMMSSCSPSFGSSSESRLRDEGTKDADCGSLV